MAYYLQFDGVTNYQRANFSKITLAGDFYIEFDMMYSDSSSNEGRILDYSQSNTDFIKFFNSSLMRVRINGVTYDVSKSYYDDYSNERATWGFRRVGSTVIFSVENTINGRIEHSFSLTSADFEFDCFGLSVNAQPAHTLRADIYSIKIYDSTDTLIHNYQPSATPDPSLPILFDTVGGNHGTLQNFTLPDAYVYYYDWLNEPADDALYDNCLSFNGVDQYCEIPQIDVADPTSSGKIVVEGKSGANERFQIMHTGLSAANGTGYYFNKTSLRLFNASYTFQTPLTTEQITNYAVYEIKWVNGGVITVTIDSVEILNDVYVAPSGIISASVIGNTFTNPKFFDGQLKSLLIEGLSETRYYDFNQDANTTNVPELINGQHGTLQGFPTPSGYVRDENGVIEGYRFNGVDGYVSFTSWTPSSTVWDLEVKFTYYGSGTILGGSSSNRITIGGTNLNYVYGGTVNRTIALPTSTVSGDVLILTIEQLGDGNVFASIINTTQSTSSSHSRSSEDTPTFTQLSGYSDTLNLAQMDLYYVLFNSAADQRNYDFTTGDADQIIDTVGGNHATIVNAPTSGYLPVVERQVFDANDYTQLENFVTGEAASAYGATYLNGKGKAALEGFTAVITNDCLPAEFDTVCTDADNQDFIIATDPLGINRLPVEKIAGSNVIWTRFDRYGNKENDLYILYGKAGESQPAVDALYGRNQVWGDYARVYHLNNDVSDSTGNSTPVNNGVTFTDGKAVFTGTEYINIGNGITSVIQNHTISMLVSPNQNIEQGILSGYDSTTGLRVIEFQTRNGFNDPCALVGRQNGSSALVINQPSIEALRGQELQATYTKDSTNQNMYFDGVSVGSFTNMPVTWDTDPEFMIGARPLSASYRFDGTIRNLFIRSFEITPDHISAEYANQSSPATFWTVGTPQDATGTGFSRVVKLTGKLLESTVPDLSFNRSTNDPVIIDNLQGVNEKIVFTGSAGAIHIKNSQLADVDASASTALVTLDNCEVGDVTG